MSVVTEDGGRTNIYAKEPQMYWERHGTASPAEQKEMYNGRWAMVGIICGFISYAITGNFFFGVF